MKSYRDNGYADGIFFDECEIGYWDLSYYTDPDKCEIFYNALKELCDYCKNIGLITVVNGVRVFAILGDYWLWESFAGYWSTNQLKFDNVGTGTRTVASNGTITYALNFTEWTLTGSCTISGGKIVNGTNGTVEIEIDMDSYLESGDELSTYDFIFFEWFGSGSNDSTLEIYCWYKQNSGDDWTAMPTKLYSGSPAVWNGINKQGRFIKFQMIFNGATNLIIDSLHLFYGYVYPYYDMTSSNGDADINPQMWNYNNAQLAYILDKQSKYYNNANNSKCQVLAHCYGLFSDTSKIEYMFILSKVFELSGWDFTHPLHQIITYTDMLDDPFGLLLSRTDNGDGSYSATFTGCSITIDTKNNTYSLSRTEPSYWYDRKISIDGTMTDWATITASYTNSNSATLHLYAFNFNTDFSSGTFSNVTAANGYLELIDTGLTGTWTSLELTYSSGRLFKLISCVFGAAASGVTCEIRFKRSDDSWSSYIGYSVGTNDSLDEEFKSCQSRITLDGDQWTTCWAYTLYYKVELLECLNVRNVYIEDDNSYLYLRVKYNDVIDMDTHVYNLYFYTKEDVNTGFIGDWWETSYGVHFYLYNTSLYRWNDSHADRTDVAGWEYLGHIFDYAFSADGKEIEYSIKKSILKGLTAEEIKVFTLVSEASTNYAALIEPDGVNTTVSPVGFDGEILYTQTEFNNFAPHGYFRSEEIYLNKNNAGFMIEFDKTTPASTTAKMYIRYKIAGQNWSTWAEVSDEYTYSNKIVAMQYCCSMSTTDKAATPYFENIVITEL
jgi:hypothetical protein